MLSYSYRISSRQWSKFECFEFSIYSKITIEMHYQPYDASSSDNDHLFQYVGSPCKIRNDQQGELWGIIWPYQAFAVHDHWLHTYELIVPQIRVPKRHNISGCESEDEAHADFDQCIYYIDILDAMDRQQEHYFKMLNQTMTQVNHALHLPQHKTPRSDSRSKRKFFWIHRRIIPYNFWHSNGKGC